jgi:hypothetical protein
MADLNHVTVYMCSSNFYWKTEVMSSNTSVSYTVEFKRRPPPSDVQYDYVCGCKAFTFNPGKPCRHIKTVKVERCGWNGEMEPTAEPRRKDEDHVCPRCEGPVEAVMVGV